MRTNVNIHRAGVSMDLVIKDQIKEGFTPIPNGLLEAISSTGLNGSQFRIVLAVIRYTYGFGRRSHEMSVSYLAKATGLVKRQVRKEIERLLGCKVLIEYKEPTKTSCREIGLNYNYSEWFIYTSGSDKPEDQLHPWGGDQIDLWGGDQLLHSGEVQLHPQEIKNKEIFKENMKQMLFDHWNSLKIIKHRELTPTISKALDKVIKDPDYFITCMNHYSVMYHDKSYGLCNWAWGLKTFIDREKGYHSFADDGEKWINYQNRGGGKDEYPDNW